MRYTDLVVLTAYMADQGYSAKDVAYAVEKPWKFADMLADAEASEFAEREDVRSGSVWLNAPSDEQTAAAARDAAIDAGVRANIHPPVKALFPRFWE